jgi:hypothetical protein
MRDQEKYPKVLASRRRGGLFKHQNKFLFDLEQTTSSARSNGLIAQPLLLC